jgi:quinol monooxygenase YgiN
MIIAVVQITVRPDRRSELSDVGERLLSFCRGLPGCLDYRLAEELGEPGRLLALERWTDEEAFLSHRDAVRDEPEFDAWRELVLSVNISTYSLPD